VGAPRCVHYVRHCWQRLRGLGGKWRRQVDPQVSLCAALGVHMLLAAQPTNCCCSTTADIVHEAAPHSNIHAQRRRQQTALLLGSSSQPNLSMLFCAAGLTCQQCQLTCALKAGVRPRPLQPPCCARTRTHTSTDTWHHMRRRCTRDRGRTGSLVSMYAAQQWLAVGQQPAAEAPQSDTLQG
jgi:hypothetical protein